MLIGVMVQKPDHCHKPRKNPKRHILKNQHSEMSEWTTVDNQDIALISNGWAGSEPWTAQ